MMAGGSCVFSGASLICGGVWPGIEGGVGVLSATVVSTVGIVVGGAITTSGTFLGVWDTSTSGSVVLASTGSGYCSCYYYLNIQHSVYLPK